MLLLHAGVFFFQDFVPAGFTITTECCDAYYKSGEPESAIAALKRFIELMAPRLFN